MEKVAINGIEIFTFKSSSDLIEYVNDKKGILVAINAGKINKATPELREIINSNIGYADGIGAVTVLHKKGFKDCPKIPGCELWLQLIDRFVNSKSFYFVGATDGVINGTIEKLKKEYPQINIIGYRNGFLKNDREKSETIRDIVEKKPDVVFVAMGSPKQEIFMNELQKRHPAIYQGLGGSFKVYCGEDKRAPKWFIDHNMEGVYRAFFLNVRQGKLKRFFSDLGFFIKLHLGIIK